MNQFLDKTIISQAADKQPESVEAEVQGREVGPDFSAMGHSRSVQAPMSRRSLNPQQGRYCIEARVTRDAGYVKYCRIFRTCRDITGKRNESDECSVMDYCNLVSASSSAPKNEYIAFREMLKPTAKKMQVLDVSKASIPFWFQNVQCVP